MKLQFIVKFLGSLLFMTLMACFSSVSGTHKSREPKLKFCSASMSLAGLVPSGRLWAKLVPAPLELAESLEQLRWMVNGYKIHVKVVTTKSVGIDKPDDLLKITNNAWLTPESVVI